MKLTFLTPHQKPTSGGVYVIHQYAEFLAQRHQVTVVVMNGRPMQELQGCRVLAHEGRAEGDIVVVPADMPDTTGFDDRKVYFLQGTERNEGFSSSPVAAQNVSNGNRVIACSQWLADESRRRGGMVRHVPLGLDREVFFRPRAPWRNVHIAMMTHTLPSKGTQDGLAAIEEVKRRRPGLRIVYFGTWDPGIVDATFIDRPSRSTVARIFRRAQIVVSPSIEEGFGLPGLEAMACGVALVTTDSKGPRDYAVNNVNAAIVSPGDRVGMSEAIAALVDDRLSRKALAQQGWATAQSFPTWDESASRFERALQELASN